MPARNKDKRKKDFGAGEDGKELSHDFLRSVGGRSLTRSLGIMGGDGASEVYNFGWIAPAMRSLQEHAAVGMAEAEMPKFSPPPVNDDLKAALLFETWKHPMVKEANGREFTGILQITGSCVGAGGGTMWMTLGCIEAIRLGDPELPLVPFWLLPYGRSRFYGGMKTPGEGSFGGTFGKAAESDGTLPANTSGLPQPTEKDGMLTWGRTAELSWSDGDAQQTMNLLPKSRAHLINTVAKCSSANDVKAAIQAGYPCTCASMYAHDGGKVQGSPPVLLAKRKGQWAHQMSILAWMAHPQFGDLFWQMNQWGQSAHGKCPTGAPWGGVWITAADVDWICRDEVYAFSQFNGFPAPTYDIPWAW